MEFKEAMRIWKRMCKSNEYCETCPLYQVDKNQICKNSIKEYPDKTEAVFAKWEEEHPEKTIMDDFFEKHPNAPKYDDAIPKVCAAKLGYAGELISKCISNAGNCVNCRECWRQPFEEAE